MTKTAVADASLTETRKARAYAWFQSLQNDIIARFEALEDAASPPLYKGAAGRFEKTPWKRGGGAEDLGGGTMAVMKGRLFEKVGVHVSCVDGGLRTRVREDHSGGRQVGRQVLGGGRLADRAYGAARACQQCT